MSVSDTEDNEESLTGDLLLGSQAILQTSDTCNITYGFGMPMPQLPQFKLSIHREFRNLMQTTVQTIQPSTELLSKQSSDDDEMVDPM
jgi:hypothetical protein